MLDIFFKPRSATALCFLIFELIYFTFFCKIRGNIISLITSSSFFFVYCVNYIPESIPKLPHPIFWKIVHTLGIFYMVFLVFLTGHCAEDIKGILRNFDENVGKLETRGNMCDRDILDRFFVAHFIGWYVKALVLRDWNILWFCSIMFEILEISLDFLLPNFYEIWWDRLFLDILGCNFVGMYLGMKTINYFIDKNRDMGASIKFYNWDTFKNKRHFLISSVMIVCLLLGELNGFFLKTTLHIPIKSNINLTRLLLMAGLFYLGVCDYYEFLIKNVGKIGQSAWLCTAIICTETLLCTKLSLETGIFYGKYPSFKVIISWLFTALSSIFLYFYHKILNKRIGYLFYLPFYFFGYLLIDNILDSGLINQLPSQKVLH